MVMACNKPKVMFRDVKSGELQWAPPRESWRYERLEVPCNRCFGCKAMLQNFKMLQMVAEAYSHEETCALTLTYDDAHLPSGYELDYRDIQLFLKRLRKRLAKDGVFIRFFCAGEYGKSPRAGTPGRPHWHLVLFGYRPDDTVLAGKSASRVEMLESRTLTRVWGRGRVVVQSFNAAMAAYVAKYTSKSVLDEAEASETFALDTGLIFHRKMEFCRQSTKPGLGARFFMKYADQIIRDGYMVVSGVRWSLPRYFLTLMERYCPDAYPAFMERRKERGMSHAKSAPDKARNEAYRKKVAERKHREVGLL